MRARLGQHQLAHPLAVVRQVEAAARSELERAAARLREQLVPRLAQAGVLRPRNDSRVEAGEKPFVQAQRIAAD